ncbi:electron transport complex subunit RsxC [Cloacibacillus porcorum]|uniref:electron transport complex subunit RsxC n=1 Tax=Cloacibacillus porcorum TaxID=1197717 RepID=UPI0023F2C31E|nr:electron transport complex subunit RsxC [Cloacibacillus porcorum]MDD7648390.1 electron transport complex subunit RsxC [Cloacibacillus porcorum]MDY4094439.1 electron transport complex subunit RsxC [Cloacibacillus porcorum]
MRLPTFWGGIHPPQNKDLTVNEEIESYLPKGELVFPMAQNLGAPCSPVVAKGERVLVGTRLGNNDAFVSAPILSSVSGTVKDVTMRMTTPGMLENCVVVENDGLYETAPEWKPLENYESADPKEYIKRIREAGIVGFGGATFPTAVKLSPPPDKKINWLIVNGVECEPYLNCDNRLMLEGAEKVIKGLQLVMRIFPEAKGVIAIENNKPQAISVMNDLVAKLGAENIIVQPLAVKYPQGAEKMLIEAITGQEYIMTALPADVGCIILNVRTVFQIYRAIAEGNPATTRIVTVTGDAVAHPKNIKVPLGTSVRELIDLCGGFKEQPVKILSGGPMMGISMRSIDVPVVKGTSGILALTAKSAMLKPITPCLRCGRCVTACPMGLVPNVLEPLVLERLYTRFEEEGGMNCIECGSCTYMCPANRPLTQGCRDGKASVMAMRRKAAAK